MTVDEAIAKLQAISLAGYGSAEIQLEESFASDVELLAECKSSAAIVLMI